MVSLYGNRFNRYFITSTKEKIERMIKVHDNYIKCSTCGGEGEWECVDGQYIKTCEHCLYKQGYDYCDDCNEWSRDVQERTKYDNKLCDDCLKEIEL